MGAPIFFGSFDPLVLKDEVQCSYSRPRPKGGKRGPFLANEKTPLATLRHKVLAGTNDLTSDFQKPCVHSETYLLQL